MEPKGHGLKSSDHKAVFSSKPQEIVSLTSPSNRNIGIDYITKNPDKSVKGWFDGVVTKAGREGGYGYRIHIKTDIPYQFQGKNYIVYTAYAHLKKIDVTVGQSVKKGEHIGEMGSTGLNSNTTNSKGFYEHIDFSIYFFKENERTYLSPNLFSDTSNN